MLVSLLCSWGRAGGYGLLRAGERRAPEPEGWGTVGVRERGASERRMHAPRAPLRPGQRDLHRPVVDVSGDAARRAVVPGEGAGGDGLGCDGAWRNSRPFPSHPDATHPNVSGSGPVISPRSSSPSRPISSALSSKSNTWKFSSIRGGVA